MFPRINGAGATHISKHINITRVGLVYVVGVVSGSLAMSVIHPQAFLAGASGGVYALACAHIAAILLNWREDSLILRQRLRNKKATSPTFGKIVRVGRVLVVGGIIGVDIVTANTYYDILYNWMRLKKLIDDQNRNELGDYYENHKEWPIVKR